MKSMTRFNLSMLAIASVFSLQATATEHVIAQKDKSFDKPELAINVGDSIKFDNHDATVHNLYSRSSGSEFDSGSLKPEESYTVNFSEKTTVRIRCAIHPRMRLYVVVSD